LAEPGTPEFLAEWKAAVAEHDKPVRYAGTLQQVINDDQHASAFTNLAPNTRIGYVRRIRKIEIEFGDMPLRVLEDPRARREFLD
jgi:hypothetical protein